MVGLLIGVCPWKGLTGAGIVHQIGLGPLRRWLRACSHQNSCFLFSEDFGASAYDPTLLPESFSPVTIKMFPR